MFVLASSIASVGIPSPAICQVRLWLFTLGIALVLSSSAVKAFRLWVIFSIKSVSLGKRLGNQRMLALVTCGSGDNAISIAFFAITAVYNGLLLCAVILFAYRTRNVSSGYRESSWSLYSAQCIAVFSVVVGAFSLLDFGSLTIMAFVVKHVATWFTTMFVFSVLVGRVALAVYISANVPAASNTRRSGYISTEILSAGEVLAGRVIVPHGPWLGDGAAAGGGAGHEKPSSGHGGSKTDVRLHFGIQ
ncbi:hypothetical protein BCR44DRAFT_1422878 [Catenaria anguillulae PL171]|uniref:G-protein coupled receptors family 3 profile domain-containing protein n=1 Tax=Catenaria anguillulae PL171 TaxID=765915 RepID=A0A1Y2I3N9_9FUNG|nr:hypothetical protein BCR44DRAFT_1422878 [Catenaria anguillulae PL171]